jgi:hypothetical protein
MQDSKPLAYTKIIRRLSWNGNDEEGLVEEVCDIAAEEIALSMGPTYILTKCHWTNMPDN